MPKSLNDFHLRLKWMIGLMVIMLGLSILGGCGGESTHSSITPTQPGVPPPPPSSSPTAASAFGMQCGLSVGACGGPGSTILWPSSQAKPGFLRLHDSDTFWSQLEPSPNQYDWKALDIWLDTIAQHEPIDVSQVFMWVPCWDAPTCVAPPVAQPNGTNAFPNDLTASGSPTFNSFVTAFVQHCSPAGNCTKDIIKYYEMWNEWNQPVHWTGTPLQLYRMLAPAVAIIRQNVPNAVILSPSTTAGETTYVNDLKTWLGNENQYGKISDWVAWHLYLGDVNNAAATNTPEFQWQKYATNLIDAQQSVSGWADVAYANTETNFHGQKADVPYTCSAAQYSADDCTGQIVRWQLLHTSFGASNVTWYKWNITIGSNPQYAQAYYSMMQYLEGGKFTANCSFTTDGGNNQIWSCPFTEASGTTALFVWTPTEGNTVAFSVPSGFTDYKDLTGSTTTISGATINIGPEPIMFEQ